MAQFLMQILIGKQEIIVNIKFYLILISLLFSIPIFSEEVQLNFVAGTVGGSKDKKIKCSPKPVASKCNGPECGEEVKANKPEFYKCKFILTSSNCLRRKSRSYKRKGKTYYTFVYKDLEEPKGCLGKDYAVNILLNRAAVFNPKAVDITYFLHGRVTQKGHNLLVEGSGGKGKDKGAVSRYKLEERISKVKKPMAFVYPEFITDEATQRKDGLVFSQFNEESSWMEFQDTVEQFLGTEKRGVSRRNLMGHSQAYARIAQMKDWKNIKFDSTTLIDSIYGYPKEFNSIAKNYETFGSFTSYGIYRYGKKPKENKTYNFNKWLRNRLKRRRGKVNTYNKVTAPLSNSRVPSIVLIKHKRRTPDRKSVNHPNITRYVFDQYLIQRGYLTSEEVYGN